MKSTLNIDSNGNKRWLTETGKYHREDGPAIELANGAKYWYLNGVQHRTDGPAYEDAYYKCWLLNGIKHRENGPAEEGPFGKFYYQNNKRHRLDGPAIVDNSYGNAWYINDKLINVSNQQDFEQYLRLIAFV